MQSFRTELENNVVEKDIIELEKKIQHFKEGKINEEKFRTLRLARGIYGQRQKGVQMVRIKIPYGKTNTRQLLTIANIADKYSNGKLHFTTRQDVQIHYVSLDHTPMLWAELEKSDITLREACGNTVRNITASEDAGINPNEPFDVSPYAQAMFSYFLRRPFANELGRKFKIAFSSDESDSALTYIHDLGFIPKINNHVKGFKVLIGGGLGAQPFHAQTAKEFLPANEIIAFTEKVIRVFDEYGERTNRHKARLKYLIDKIGLDVFLEYVESTKNVIYPISENFTKNISTTPNPLILPDSNLNKFIIPQQLIADFEVWKSTNLIQQKQKGYYAVYVRFPLGNTDSHKIRELSEIIKKYTSDDLRITINQNLLLRFVPHEHLKILFISLHKIGLALPGAKSIHNVTACPGTDTCNLGISNSTLAALEIEKYLKQNHTALIHEKNIQIKISGCMNSCGQHGMATIGFHGSSIKNGQSVLPALQLLIGGSNKGNGSGVFADKIIKFPSKRVLTVIDTLLTDYQFNKLNIEDFVNYYQRLGKDYFYQLLKPIADLNSIQPSEYLDWGQDEKFKTAIGIGECAGVVIDLVQTLFAEAKEKISNAEESINNNSYADAIYQTYAAVINAAKAVLTSFNIQASSHHAVVSFFDENFNDKNVSVKTFSEKMKQHLPGADFAYQYLLEGKILLQSIEQLILNKHEQ